MKANSSPGKAFSTLQPTIITSCRWCLGCSLIKQAEQVIRSKSVSRTPSYPGIRSYIQVPALFGFLFWLPSVMNSNADGWAEWTLSFPTHFLVIVFYRSKGIRTKTGTKERRPLGTTGLMLILWAACTWSALEGVLELKGEEDTCVFP